MPRIAGQIDVAKAEAILDAAALVFGQKGPGAPMAAIAREAKVSKQTIYNQYGSKTELMRALVERRVTTITAPLLIPGAEEHPEETLAAFGRAMIETVLRPAGSSMLRMTIQSAVELPDVAQAFYEAGPLISRKRLADFLERETEAGRLDVDDPKLAAEFFASMVIGGHQIAGLLGVQQDLSEQQVERIATQAAARFMRAYAP